MLDLFLSSLFDPKFYFGIAVGAMFSPFWLIIYTWLKARIEAKAPGATIYINEAEALVKSAEAEVQPVLNVIQKNAQDQVNSLTQQK